MNAVQHLMSASHRTATHSSEQIIQQRLEAALARSSHPQLANVEGFVDGDKVTLVGQLDAYYPSQLAQAIAWTIPGVKNVQNTIQIASNPHFG